MIPKKTIGFVLLALSCIGWVILPFIGLFKLETTLSVLLGTVILVTGELLFVAAIYFLGKQYWELIKEKIKLIWLKIKN